MASHGIQPRYPRTPTTELAHGHYSVRDYKPDPVPVEMVESIVAAAQRTSTSSNLQTYSIVAVAGEVELGPGGGRARTECAGDTRTAKGGAVQEVHRRGHQPPGRGKTLVRVPANLPYRQAD